MKVLITGAGGFLGQYFARHLDHDTHALDRSELDLNNADAVRQVLQTGQYDVVLHCASAGRNNPRSYDQNIAVNNLDGFANLVANRHLFGQLINFATGAEYDIDTNIDLARESDIWERNPSHSYGRSKNLIARQAQLLPNFYNLRIFGCFDASESGNRPLKLFADRSGKGEPFVILADKDFDMFSVKDILTVTQAVMAKKIHDKDLNLVYNTKYKLSEILMLFAKLQDLDADLIQIQGTDSRHYTGSSSLLEQYDLDLLGLEQSLAMYTL